MVPRHAALAALALGAGLLALPAAGSAAQRHAVIGSEGSHTVIIGNQRCRIIREGGLPSAPARAGPGGAAAGIAPQGSSGVAIGSGAGGSGCVIVAQPRH
ncbi:MAG TPA: hypothetical protein VJ770_26590 [Stellaceae bacterium]|nr:hypothetical protein [Stellaceae bacterium]